MLDWITIKGLVLLDGVAICVLVWVPTTPTPLLAGMMRVRLISALFFAGCPHDGKGPFVG